MNGWLHDAIMWVHIAGGTLALASGAVAVAVRKGSALHRSAGTGFVISMLVLGSTASILEPFRTPEPGSPVGGIMVCYFVATAWMTARRRDGRPGTFEKIACGLILAIAALIIGAGFKEALAPTGQIPGPGALFGVGGFCLLAGVLDLNFILRGKLSGAQRISRHVWRMCFAFFVATGSFFLGQQDILPKAIQGSPILFVLAFAPFAIMLFWLVRLRFAKMVGKLSLRLPPAPPAMPRLEMEI